MPDELDVDDILLTADDHMEKSVHAVTREFSQIRTGRASPALVEEVRVDYHGTVTPLKQLGLIRVPEARLLVIEPWDKSAMHAIEKGLSEANLGLNPQNDGKVIRIAIPPLTDERRQQLAKTCQQMAEQGRVAVRNVRRDAIDQLRKLEKDGGISEDELHRSQDEAQKLTDRYIGKIDEVLAAKEAELLEE